MSFCQEVPTVLLSFCDVSSHWWSLPRPINLLPRAAHAQPGLELLADAVQRECPNSSLCLPSPRTEPGEGDSGPWFKVQVAVSLLPPSSFMPLLSLLPHSVDYVQLFSQKHRHYYFGGLWLWPLSVNWSIRSRQPLFVCMYPVILKEWFLFLFGNVWFIWDLEMGKVVCLTYLPNYP